jgi:ABC-type polysaccharide/polyol phosphate transport system ATPase subunit
MSGESAIRLESVSKVFRLVRNEVNFAESFLRAFRARSWHRTEITGLQDATLAVEPGEWVGVVGDNGAGKSTFLRLLAGVYAPTAGSVEVRGRTVLLAGFGTGMVDELSVEENVYLYGVIYGLRRAGLSKLMPEILEWAEITPFRTACLATLSTGMKSRLAFSVVRHIDADVVLLDEALSAGDRRFHGKCRDHFSRAKQTPVTYVVASHDLDFVREHCDRAVWLEGGRVRADGPVEEVLEGYRRADSRQPAVATRTPDLLAADP